MIHEELCTYEVCKLAKEKGFDEYVEAFYAEGCDTAHSQGPEKWNEYKGRYAAPTQSLLQRWLREEKHCNIEIAVCPAPISIWIFVWSVSYGTDSHYSHRCNYDTYEQALEDALKYALENLVI